MSEPTTERLDGLIRLLEALTDFAGGQRASVGRAPDVTVTLSTAEQLKQAQNAKVVEMLKDRGYQQRYFPQRWAVTVCPGCRRRDCNGHEASSAIALYSDAYEASRLTTLDLRNKLAESRTLERERQATIARLSDRLRDHLDKDAGDQQLAAARMAEQQAPPISYAGAHVSGVQDPVPAGEAISVSPGGYTIAEAGMFVPHIPEARRLADELRAEESARALAEEQESHTSGGTPTPVVDVDTEQWGVGGE
jgi:hypothetical protein